MMSAWAQVKRLKISENKVLKVVVLLTLLLMAAPAAVQNLRAGGSGDNDQCGEASNKGQIQIPNRRPTPLFEGKEGKQKTEIHFDLATRMVTVKLLVQDPNGYFIPNIRRDNFAVYENNIRQHNATVEIEHAPVTLGLLLEFGGRAQALNRSLGTEVARAGRQLLDELGRGDKVAIWRYSDKVEKLADFAQGHETLDRVFQDLGTPEFSETNLYDALIYVVEQMRSVQGRKAIVLISSGVDTFSKSKYDDALRAARDAGTPIYVVSLVPALRSLIEAYGSAGPLARVDWNAANRGLEEIARVSGGRAYSPASTIDLFSMYDDMMENLRVRYVITYQSSSGLDLNSPRTVRVELVDSKTGGPLQITDESGRTIPARIVVQDSYVPSAASGGELTSGSSSFSK
ncbi:MAG: VWA domain-containing protein [Candidatus Sulfotelmatobacter sp.]|jgi:VWFA-related protein